MNTHSRPRSSLLCRYLPILAAVVTFGITPAVTRAAPSSNANLTSLSVSDDNGKTTTTLTTITPKPGFDAAYTTSVPNSSKNIQVSVICAGEKVKLKSLIYRNKNWHDETSGNVIISPSPLAVGENELQFEVTAEDGATVKTYSLTVIRAKTTTSNANLAKLSITTSTGGKINLSPDFSSEKTSYTASVPHQTTTIVGSIQCADAAAALRRRYQRGPLKDVVLNNVGVGAFGPSLVVGSNLIEFIVTAPDRTQKTYTITLTRAAN